MTDMDVRISLVEQNYEHLERRLDKVETKLDEMRDDIKSGQQHTIKVIIATTGTIVLGFITTIGVIISTM